MKATVDSCAQKDGLDLVTTHFVYVRWLGDGKAMEPLTMSGLDTISGTRPGYSSNSLREISRSTHTPTITTPGMGREPSSCTGTSGRRSSRL